MDQAKVGRRAPDFTATWVMPDAKFQSNSLSQFCARQYACLFFYPLDFTFVCPSEILAFNAMQPEFAARNCVLLGCSVDSHFTHLAWRQTPVEKGGIGEVAFPLISDLNKVACEAYGVKHPDGVALRGLFIIDKDFVIRHALVNDLPLGRNVEEAIRILDALQFHEQHGEVCPANWKKGLKAMRATPEGVAEYLKENFAQ